MTTEVLCESVRDGVRAEPDGPGGVVRCVFFGVDNSGALWCLEDGLSKDGNLSENSFGIPFKTTTSLLVGLKQSGASVIRNNVILQTNVQ